MFLSKTLRWNKVDYVNRHVRKSRLYSSYFLGITPQFCRKCLVINNRSRPKQQNNSIYKRFIMNKKETIRSEMRLKESPTMLSKYHKIQQINNSEQRQWPRAFHGLWTSMYLICPHLHNCCSASVSGSVGRLWLPLKLVMETCSGGQRADWAWQPISCRKPSSGGAEAAGCDSVHLSDGGKAPGWWSKWTPPVSVKIPKHWSTLVRST